MLDPRLSKEILQLLLNGYRRVICDIIRARPTVVGRFHSQDQGDGGSFLAPRRVGDMRVWPPMKLGQDAVEMVGQARRVSG